MIRIECPACAHESEAPEEYLGRQTTCEMCRETFTIKRSAPPATSNKTLTSCPDCGKSISKSAKACPGCGAPIMSKVDKVAQGLGDVGKALAAVGCLLPMLLVGGCLIVAVATTEVPPWDQQDNSTMALTMMEKFVRQRLKSPSTAEFPGVFDGAMDHVERLDDHQYMITSYVDSQNGFGAVVRTNYAGIIQQTSEDDWQLIGLEMKQQ
jgi:hypothetical protein